MYKIGLYGTKKILEHSISNNTKYFKKEYKPCNIPVGKIISVVSSAILILI